MKSKVLKFTAILFLSCFTLGFAACESTETTDGEGTEDMDNQNSMENDDLQNNDMMNDDQMDDGTEMMDTTATGM